MEVVMAHHDREARPLDAVRPEVPAELASLVARMMAKRPERRFPTPKEVARALEPFVKSAGASAERSTVAIATAVEPSNDQPAAGETTESTPLAAETPPPVPAAKTKAETKPMPSVRRVPAWLWPAAAAAALLPGLFLVWSAASSRNRPNLPDARRGDPAADRKAPDDHTSGTAAATTSGPPDQPGWTPLFNGKDTTGWKTHPSHPGHWRVENGILVGGSNPSASYLYSERGDYQDFHLLIEARFNTAGNGGVFFRSSFGPGSSAGDRSSPSGYEALINTTTGREHLRTGTLDPGDPDHDDVLRNYATPRTIPPGRWFTLEVIADGNILTNLLDGKSVAYHVDHERRHVRGHIALERRDPQSVLEFRKIEIRELNRTTQKDPREVRRLVGHGTRVNHVAFAPDDSTILSGGNSEEVWIPNDGTETRFPQGDGNLVRLWETDTGRPIGPAMTGHNRAISALAYSPDGRRAATTSHWWADATKVVFVWDLATGRRVHQFHYGTNRSHNVFDHAVSFSPDGRRVMVAYSNGTVCVWDLDGERGEKLVVLGGRSWGNEDFPMLAFAPDRRHLLTGNRRGVLDRWDPLSVEHLQSFTGHSGTVHRAASSADGRLVLSGDSSSTVRLWNVVGGEELWSAPGDGRELKCIAISPDGRRAITGGNDTIVRLWELPGGREVCRLEGHTMGVTCAAFSSDGRRAVTGSEDGTIRLWALPEPGPVKSTSRLSWADEPDRRGGNAIPHHSTSGGVDRPDEARMRSWMTKRGRS
jgi:WD40 repeat protein